MLSGADERFIDENDKRSATDVIAPSLPEEDRLGEDVELVRKLLASAPADRAWRRRGYLVLAHFNPDREFGSYKRATVALIFNRRDEQAHR